jgi:hypothetical protein
LLKSSDATRPGAGACQSVSGFRNNTTVSDQWWNLFMVWAPNPNKQELFEMLG